MPEIRETSKPPEVSVFDPDDSRPLMWLSIVLYSCLRLDALFDRIGKSNKAFIRAFITLCSFPNLLFNNKIDSA